MEEDWEMVDYYPPLKDEQEKSQARWVDAGKKVVIAGFVLSSLPFILPPLLVISALGLAVSVPYGVVFACTHKLMSMLLPSPAPPTHHGYEDITEFDGYTRDGIRREDGEGNNNNNDVVKNEEEQWSLDEQGDEKPYVNVDDTKEGEKDEKIITETKREEKDEKERENLVQEKIITEKDEQVEKKINKVTGKQRKKTTGLK